MLQFVVGGEGWIHDTGYFFKPNPRRLQIQATTVIMLIPIITVSPICVKLACPWIIINGFAPAGGCTVRVISNAQIVITTAITATQVASPKDWKQIIPIKLLNICPPKTALGWAAGVVESPNKNKVVPPKEARNNGVVAFVASNEIAIAILAPIETQSNLSKIVLIWKNYRIGRFVF